MRRGKLLTEQVYLIHKMPNNIYGEPDVVYTAPAGTLISWEEGKTNAGSESYYGGQHLYWIDLPDYGYGIGAELGVDFKFTD